MNYETENRGLVLPLRKLERECLVLRQKLGVEGTAVIATEPRLENTSVTPGHVSASQYIEKGREVIKDFLESIATWNSELTGKIVYKSDEVQPHLEELDRKRDHIQREFTHVIHSLRTLDDQSTDQTWSLLETVFEKVRARFKHASALASKDFEAFLARLDDNSHEMRRAHSRHASSESLSTTFTRWVKGFFQNPDIASPDPRSTTSG